MFEGKNVCVVIVFYNGDESINKQIMDIRNYVGKILIIDNGSTAGFDLSLIEDEQVYIIRNTENKGIAYALNQGLQYAKEQHYELLLTMDQDSYIEEKSIKLLIESIEVDNGIISVGPYYNNKKNNETKAVTNLITSGNMIHVDTIIAIGGFTNKLFIDCVDIDLSFNILAKGYSMKKIAGAKLDHKIGEVEYSKVLKIRHLAHSPKRYFYKYRNNIYIYMNYGKTLPQYCVKLFLSLIYETLKMILIEKNKIEKIKYAFLGIRQGLKKDVWNNNVANIR